MAGAFRREFHHSINKKVSKIETPLAHKLSKAQLKFIVVIV